MLVLQIYGCWKITFLYLSKWPSSHISGLAEKRASVTLVVCFHLPRDHTNTSRAFLKRFLVGDPCISLIKPSWPIQGRELCSWSPHCTKGHWTFSTAPIPEAPGIIALFSPKVWLPLGHCIEIECRWQPLSSYSSQAPLCSSFLRSAISFFYNPWGLLPLWQFSSPSPPVPNSRNPMHRCLQGHAGEKVECETIGWDGDCGKLAPANSGNSSSDPRMGAP